MQRAEARSRDQDLLQRLADEKYEEFVATQADLRAPSSGDFEDRGLSDIDWEAESEATGVENLQSITVKVQARRGSERDPVGQASGLVYVPPATQGGSAQ